jgi:hypothetical protein
MGEAHLQGPLQTLGPYGSIPEELGPDPAHIGREVPN